MCATPASEKFLTGGMVANSSNIDDEIEACEITAAQAERIRLQEVCTLDEFYGHRNILIVLKLGTHTRFFLSRELPCSFCARRLGYRSAG